MFGSLLALSYVGYNQAAMLDFDFFFSEKYQECAWVIWGDCV